MQVTDTIADLLTRIRNASSAKHDTVDVPASNMKKAIVQILVDEGYVKDYNVLEDENGAFSRIFLNTVRKKALEHGFDIITCRCPFFPSEKTEHIFIPEIGLGFMTKNKRHKFDILPYRVIHSRRFNDEKKYNFFI